MTKRRFRKFAAAITLAGMLSFSAGCWGSFGLTNKVYDWNAQVSGDKWVRWLVFLGLVIIPVYEVSLIVDALILNTVEFHAGDNPVASVQTRGNTRVAITEDGDEYEVVPESATVAAVYRDGRRIGSAHITEDGSIRVLDADGALVKILSAPAPASTPSEPMRRP